MRAPLLRVLRSTAAVGAIVLGSASANAACTTTNNVVTCSDANTTDQVNQSLNNAPPPSVSLIITEGAVVTRGNNSQINPSGIRFPGAIGYTNSGTVGTPGANVDFNYFGSFNNRDSANTFTFNNSGTQNGGIFAFNVGGAITGTNSGTVTRGISVETVGPITFTNTGTVFNNNSFFFDSTALRLSSSRGTFEFRDGGFRFSETGGLVTATIGGTVGIPASGTTAFQPQNVEARGVGGVDLTVTGNVGQVFATSGGGTSENRFTGTFTGDTSTSVSSFSIRESGGDARVTLTESGRATDLVARARAGAATVVVNGTVAGGGASASAFGSTANSSFDSFSNFRTGAGNSQSSGTSVATGGAALADVGATGRVAGNVSASSNAGSATVRIAGVVGDATTGSSFFSGGSIFASSVGTNSSFQSRSVSQSFESFESSRSSSQSLAGGAALATVAATGQVFGSATVRGDVSATLENAGRIGGSALAQSETFLFTASSSQSSGTVTTQPNGTRTRTNTFTFSDTFEIIGGTASLINRAGASIGGSAQVIGTSGASLDNGGNIGGGVFLDSTGTRQTSTFMDRNTVASTPAAGGTVTTSLREFSSSSISRAIGGAVTGNYSGTVGRAPSSGSASFVQVTQRGNTASTATLTGTLFGNFSGSAGGQNFDSTNAFTSSETRQPSGASTRDATSRSTDMATQIASSSSLNVGTNGSATGSVTLSSGGGDATFTNSGRIAGDVAVNAGTGFNSARTFESSASFTRAAPAPGSFFTPEVQQSGTENSTFENRRVAGTATATVNTGGSVGGSVTLNGVRGSTLNNAGTIGGSVFLISTGEHDTSSRTERSTSTSTPATGGTVTTSLRESTSSRSSRAIGGAVTGNYSGTVGIASATNRFTSPTSVEQRGTAASTATVTGTLFANFSGSAGGQNFDSTGASTRRETTQPSGASTRDETDRSTETTTQIASSSSLTVGTTGRIADNGSGAGSVALNSAGGNATFTNDGRVDGNVTVNAGTGFNTTRASSSSSSSTRAAPAPGSFFTPEVLQSQTSNSTSDDRRASGTATATVNTGGSIGGNLTLTGSGTGAGSLAATVLVNGTVGGAVIARTLRTDIRSSSSNTFTRTSPNTGTNSRTTFTSSTPSAASGNVLVTVNGVVGGAVVAAAGAGSATVDLNGRAGTTAPNGINVSAFDFANTSEIAQTFTGPFFFGTPTSSRMTTSSTAVGGTATLNVAANADVRAAGLSSAEGDIIVRGFTGSTLNIAAGSRILQNTGQVFVGASFGSGSSTVTGTFTGNTQTGSTTTSTTTFTGGPTVINNAGVIGSAANQTRVSVFGVGGATVNNSGTINGSVLADAESSNRTTTSTVTDQNDFIRRRTVTTVVSTAVGGLAQVNNTGLVTGGITALGATGTVTNSGVVRGQVTLGSSVNNFSTTTTTTNMALDGGGFRSVSVISPSVANSTLFTQNYTLNQNGLLLSGIAVTGTTTVDPSGATVRTSNVNATVNLNNGSITLGDITAGPDTNTHVNLNGSGFLGIALNEAASGTGPGQLVTAAEPIASTGRFAASESTAAAVPGQPGASFQPTASIARFTAIDPTLGGPAPLPAGSRVSGVQTLTKTGDGTFVIVGAPLVAGGATAAPIYTLDVGTLRVSGGELQLGLTGTDATANFFGIRGNVENNANLVIGRRITDGRQTAIQGINVSVLGNVTNAPAGNLVVGVNPTFARSSAAAGGTLASFAPFGPGSSLLSSTNSFVRVDGNLTLAGNVAVQAAPGGLFEAGRLYDLFSVSGSFTNTGTVRSNFASPFVSFVLTPRSEGGRTIVSLNATRRNFDTVATDRNSANAAGALQATLPTLFNGLRAGAGAANAAFVQDLANIVSALDTQLTTAQAAQVFNELSSGEIYGSLAAISTTEPFGEATDGLSTPGKEAGFGLWFRPTGQFGTFRANEEAGASAVEVNNHGGSIGLNFATGNGGHAGIAGGYGKLDVDAVTPEQAEAETYMVGIYAAQQLGGLHLSGQAVYGKSEWDVTRTLPILARVASGSFDSEEMRATLRAAYTIAMLPNFDLSPFAKVEARRYKFDGFTETGANAVSLVVDRRAKTVVSPEIGLRMAGALGSQIRPFAEASYIFQGDVGSDRNVSFVSNPSATFSLEGVDPRDSIKGAAGVAVDFGRGTFFFRGDYRSGGDQQVGSVRSGLLFKF